MEKVKLLRVFQWKKSKLKNLTCEVHYNRYASVRNMFYQQWKAQRQILQLKLFQVSINTPYCWCATTPFPRWTVWNETTFFSVIVPIVRLYELRWLSSWCAATLLHTGREISECFLIADTHTLQKKRSWKVQSKTVVNCL